MAVIPSLFAVSAANYAGVLKSLDGETILRASGPVADGAGLDPAPAEPGRGLQRPGRGGRHAEPRADPGGLGGPVGRRRAGGADDADAGPERRGAAVERVDAGLRGDRQRALDDQRHVVRRNPLWRRSAVSTTT